MSLKEKSFFWNFASSAKLDSLYYVVEGIKLFCFYLFISIASFLCHRDALGVNQQRDSFADVEV